MKYLPLVLLLLVLAGCSLPQDRGSTIQQEQRESVAGNVTADLADRTFSQPTPTKIEIPTGKDGNVAKIEIPETRSENKSAVTSASETSDSAASGKASAYVSTPFLLSAGIGLLLLAAACWLFYMLFRKSMALRSAWKVGDEYLSHGIDSVRSMAQAETDPHKSALLNSIVGTLESKRAEFNAD